MKLSVVTSLYRSATTLREFHARISVAAQEAAGEDYEIVMVNDGSPDTSLELACEIAELDPHLVVIELSRNFGHHPAFWCGLHHAKGDLCFLIDCDLEVDPAVLSDFLARLEQTGSDTVYGVQLTRQGPAQTRVLGGLFWKLFSALSDIDVPADIMTERLLTRRYIDALLTMPDRNMFLGAMYYWPGFVQVPLPLTKTPRQGRGAYSLLGRFRLLVEAVSSFSSAPLKIIFWAGLGISTLSMIYSIYLILQRIFLPDTLLSGFTFLALASVGSCGIILMALGVIGLYVHRIFRQVQGRPVFIVREIYGNNGKYLDGRS